MLWYYLVRNMRKDVPLGIRLIRYIYLVNVILYILSLVIFLNRIFILGRQANKGESLVIRLALICMPLYLYFRLRNLKKDAWVLAIYFHIFFLINNSLGFLEFGGYVHSLIRISGVYSSIVYSPTRLFVLALNTIVNLFILGYLFRKRAYFYTEE